MNLSDESDYLYSLHAPQWFAVIVALSALIMSINENAGSIVGCALMLALIVRFGYEDDKLRALCWNPITLGIFFLIMTSSAQALAHALGMAEHGKWIYTMPWGNRIQWYYLDWPCITLKTLAVAAIMFGLWQLRVFGIALFNWIRSQA